MDKIGLYSKDKSELFEKIKMLIEDENLNDFYREGLQDWMKWFRYNYDKIILKKIDDNKFFYRAYYEEPNFYSIQLWAKNGDMIVCVANLYANKNILGFRNSNGIKTELLDNSKIHDLDLLVNKN